MEKFDKGVIVLGGHVQGLGIVRIFGTARIRCVVADFTKSNIARHSRYCHSFLQYKKGKLLEFLLSLTNDQKYKNWLLIPTDDSQIQILSQNYTELGKYFRLSVPEWNRLEVFYDKKLTYRLCEKYQIPIAKTYYPERLEDLESLDIKYPAIIKPSVMHKFFTQTKKKVFLCHNLHELKVSYQEASLVISKDEILIQEVIPGGSENQYSVCFYFKRKPIVSLIAKRSRQHPIDFGNATTFAETVDELPELYALASKILEIADYEGLAEVEFKYHPETQEFLFLEVNPRTWKWHTISRNSNSPFLLSLLNNIYFETPIFSNSWEKAYFRDILTDIPVILRMIFKGIYKPKKYDKIVHAVWDSQDPKPFIYELLYLPYLIMKRS